MRKRVRTDGRVWYLLHRSKWNGGRCKRSGASSGGKTSNYGIVGAMLECTVLSLLVTCLILSWLNFDKSYVLGGQGGDGNTRQML